ncbi:MAG: PD-(D/E)XK nuclease family protein [Acidimicrobiaceae bacterium]|nr:PD-(D/E)XK nuclease family protein [Acidimicrobiaceae bacterium]MYF44273.1 PD-(D/E)XK nuclease family protein [Acidimicrobiaceae bacterium]MYJ35117.1 PD-(D/E)XK nuclease family protein [Acidimicrobiaceae bacterium]
MHADQYNPAQQQVVSLLGAPKSGRPEFDPGLRDELRSLLEERMEPLVEPIESGALGDDNLFLNKFKLAQVLGCERKFMAERSMPFEWSPPLAKGTIMHKAIELSVHWRGEGTPLALVDEAMASLENAGKRMSDYLTTCGESERAELRSAAGASMTQFLECFPPLKTAWRPTTESSIQASLHGGLIVLSGKPDLTLGQPAGTVAGKVIVDFKTGRPFSSHREDLRLYALLETLRILPPRLVATYYLDQASIDAEEVTHDLLLSAAERVIDGAHRYVELVTGTREPGVAPGPSCRWCPVQPDCDEGTAYLEGSPEGGPEDW